VAFNNATPQQPQQPQQPDNNVVVHFDLTNGKELDVYVPSLKMPEFLREIGEAIDNQSSIMIGTGVVNGRHIINCTY